MHTGGRMMRIKVLKLVNSNAIKHQKGVPSGKKFHNPYIPSLPRFSKNLMDPPP
jgi:hypothetical protein